MRKEKLTEGMTCECGKYEKYPAYIYAHWDDPVIYTCECGIAYVIFRGRATREK